MTHFPQRWVAGVAVVVLVVGAAALNPIPTAAKPTSPKATASTDRALGNGLGRLLEQSGASTKQAGGLRIDQAALAIRDTENRVLVDLTPQAGIERAAYRRQAESLGLIVRSVDGRHGTLEGFAPLSAVRALAALPGTGTLAQAVKPRAQIGKATSQGVALHRVDRAQARGASGAGISIGALSDSYDVATTTVDGQPLAVHAAQDVASGDLPGSGNPAYPAPVTVVEDGDSDGSVDEGRAMLQIAHDVAPAAKLCFATAFTGLVGFADNVRRLADPNGSCRANVIVDDVQYLEEPMFSDSVLSDAIDDVAEQGVHYFTSAGNEGVQAAWASRARLVSRTTGIRGTNLDFSAVDPTLYSGGLQDMNPGPGIDIA